jgi:hypothetical protein
LRKANSTKHYSFPEMCLEQYGFTDSDVLPFVRPVPAEAHCRIPGEKNSAVHMNYRNATK